MKCIRCITKSGAVLVLFTIQLLHSILPHQHVAGHTVHVSLNHHHHPWEMHAHVHLLHQGWAELHPCHFQETGIHHHESESCREFVAVRKQHSAKAKATIQPYLHNLPLQATAPAIAANVYGGVVHGALCHSFVNGISGRGPPVA